MSTTAPVVTGESSKAGPLLNQLVQCITGEAKLLRGTEFTKQPSYLLLLKSVFTPGKLYRFRCVRNAVLTTSGTGTLQLATGVYPSQFQEFSALSSLFSEARLRSTRIRYAFYYNASPTIALCSSFDPFNNGSTTPTFNVAAAQPGAKLWPLAHTAAERVNRWTAKQLRTWSSIQSSGGGSDPTSGCRGCWYHSLSGTGVVSEDIAVYIIEADYEFRNPQ